MKSTQETRMRRWAAAEQRALNAWQRVWKAESEWAAARAALTTADIEAIDSERARYNRCPVVEAEFNDYGC